ncbi:hypothetical protein MUP46_01035 [Patescibacteria group bacterium]|nr:hypothetical protein [Patescibacteria group bacterium]
MNKEFKELLGYCKDNGIKVVFTDSKILHDYSAMNPEAARAMGFPDIDNNKKTKEILIDKTLSEETQVQNLKHELIEMRLMENGVEYWPAHLVALKTEKMPFNYDVMADIRGHHSFFSQIGIFGRGKKPVKKKKRVFGLFRAEPYSGLKTVRRK